MNYGEFETSGNSIWNQPFFDHLEENYFSNVPLDGMQQEADEFLNIYPEWILSSKMNKFTGFDKLPYRFVSLGTTQAMDWWHYWTMSEGRRLRMYKGEYPYNRDVLLEEEWMNIRYIDETPLAPGDSVIISFPFSGTGGKHSEMEKMFDLCDEMDIPVFVDCAWFGTCYDLEGDLNRDCIKMIAFSTTKGLSCGNWRSGIVFSRLDVGSLSVQTEWHHGIHLNVSLANCLFKEFSPDTVPKKFKVSQHAVCEHYGLEPTSTIHIAQAPKTDEWNHFARDGAYNRVNIRKAVKRYKSTGEFSH